MPKERNKIAYNSFIQFLKGNHDFFDIKCEEDKVIYVFDSKHDDHKSLEIGLDIEDDSVLGVDLKGYSKLELPEQLLATARLNVYIEAMIDWL